MHLFVTIHFISYSLCQCNGCFKYFLSLFSEQTDASIQLFSCLCTTGSSSSEEEYGVREVPSSDYAKMKKLSLSSHQKEQLKDRYITPHKTKLTSAQKESHISIFFAVIGNYNVVLGFFLVSFVFLN